MRRAFAKLKALLRKAAERTVDGLWRRIGSLVDPFSGDVKALRGTDGAFRRRIGDWRILFDLHRQSD